MNEIENAKIIRADLSMEDHGVLTCDLVLEGYGWGCNFGGYVLGQGWLGADPKDFKGYESGTEAIMRIMNVVGVSRFSELEGKYIRAKLGSGWGNGISAIGNIIEDKWFSYKEFLTEKEKKNEVPVSE